MKNVLFMLGFLWYCTVGSGKGKSFWHALSNYSGMYLYGANKPYSYKRAKDLWRVEV